MIDPNFKNEGEFVNYFILPERKSVEFVSFKTRHEFDSLMNRYSAKELLVDWKKMKAADDGKYSLNLARIALAKVYELSNGLMAIDQFEIDKANPYYLCESLADFKLIKKYLLALRVENTMPVEVMCSLYDHDTI